VSRTTISNYLQALVTEELLISTGNTRARKYERRALQSHSLQVRLMAGTQEDIIWKTSFAGLLDKQPKNIVDISQYCFTEILNNCIDHSGSFYGLVHVVVYYDEINIWVIDTGIGIFEKIKLHFRLADHRHALLELAKGKLTSDKKHHSGEGIFFTSRMLNRFIIDSGNLFYIRERRFDDEWLIETNDTESPTKGTSIRMSLATNATWTRQDVFNHYQEAGNISFRKTHVPLKLGVYPGEQLISRSQAKRVVARFGSFAEVILDYAGVQQIGQGFADEIYRVFAADHPDIKLVSIRTSPDVKRMIDYVQRGGLSDEDNTFFTAGLLSKS
jgi:hypothetical protein